MALSDEVKDKVSLVEIVERDVTWDASKTSASRGDYWAPCPFHAEKTSSFHVQEKPGERGQFYCFGCHEKGSVIDYVMARNGMGFGDATKHLAKLGGVASNVDPAHRLKVEAERRQKIKDQERIADAQAHKGLDRARKLWRFSKPDTPELREYLTGRGVRLSAIGGVPATLRYHPSLDHRDQWGKVIHTGPAMVAIVGRKKMVGIHRTWIDGPARARFSSGVKIPKQMLGLTGGMFGAPICLSPPNGDFLLVGEGIESTLCTLGVVAMTGARPSAEAAISLGALAGPGDKAHQPNRVGRTGKRLPSPVPDFQSDKPGWLPPEGTSLCMVLADPSSKCPETARLTAERAQAKIARHTTERTDLAVPRNRWDHDDDFADLAQKGELYD